MAHLEEIQRSIKNAEDLSNVVRTMKVLSAVSIRQFEQAATSLDDYYRTVELGMQILLRDEPAFPVVNPSRSQRPNLGIIVIGSGQGMCGRFNESLLDFVTQRLDKLSYNVTHILGVGEYISGLLEMNGWDISHKINVPSSVEGINATVSEILLTLERWQSEQVHRSIIFHHRPQSNNSYTPRMHTLYPPDEQQFRPLKEKPWPTNNIPQYRMEPDKLLSALLHQFFFVSLYRAFAQSLASEHASRLVAMQTAEQKIDERIDHLTTQFRSQRQTAITAEVLDIIASWETSGEN